MISKSLLILSFFSFFLVDLQAQESFETEEHVFVGLSYGYSPNSIVFLGKTPDTQTTVIQLNYSKRLNWKFRELPVFYLVNITPFINFDYPKRDRNGVRDIAKGFGFSPIGFGIKKKINQHLGLYLNTAGGFIIIDKKFPTDKGRKLNYTFEFSPEISVQVYQSFSFSLGYKFHHISNAQTGSENPGIDSNFIFLTTYLSI